MKLSELRDKYQEALKVYGKVKQVARCGNAVPPPFATALVRANFPEWCDRQLTTMAELKEAVAV